MIKSFVTSFVIIPTLVFAVTKQVPAKQVPVKQVRARQVQAKQISAKQVPAKQVPAKKVPPKKVPPKKIPAKQLPASPVVDVFIAIESLCKTSQFFYNKQLVEAYNQLGDEVMNLTVIPFGKAKYFEVNETVKCQHLKGECDANSWQQCIIHFNPHPSKYLPPIDCMFKKLPMGDHDQPFNRSIFEKCIEDSGLPLEPIQLCHDDPGMSNMLQKDGWLNTLHNLTDVPYVEMAGKPSRYSDMTHFALAAKICRAFKRRGGKSKKCNEVFEVRAKMDSEWRRRL